MRRDEQILDAACRLFYERGFAAVGVDEIGTAAGISGPAIYRHFSSKHEILATLFEQTHDLLLDQVAGRFAEPADELAHLIRGHLEFVLANPALAVVYHREGRSLADPFRARWRRREQRYLERWTDCVYRCFPDSSRRRARTATEAVIYLLGSVPEWSNDAQRDPNLVDFVTAMALSGLAILGTAGTGRERTVG